MSAGTKAKPKMKIQPLEDRVVIMPADEAEAMRGGLYIPDTAKEKPTQGEVIAVGPGRIEKGERVKMDLAVGDKVIYGKYSGTEVTIDGEQLLILREVEKRTGKPAAFIESDLVDPRYFSAANIKNRLESYFQMIKQKRAAH